MKKEFFKRLVLVAVIITTMAGCTQEKPQTSIPGAEIYSPEKIASMYISSLQMNQFENISLYFSKMVDGSIIDKYAKSFCDSVQVGQFKTKNISGDDNNATVQVVYNYTEKSASSSADMKKKYKTVTMKLVKEDGIWKIRTTGIDDTDQAIEKEIFLECMNTVMDVTIAQEKIRSTKDVYSSSLSELLKVVAFKESQCSELSIDNADENSYLVKATTKNLKPCSITADTDSHHPEAYDECFE